MKTLLFGLLAILLLDNPGSFAATQNDAVTAKVSVASTATQEGGDQSAQSAKTKEEGGSGIAAQFWEWSEQQVTPYL